MQIIRKPVGTREETLGNIDFPVAETLAELLESYGEDIVINIANKSIAADYERVAREALKKEGATEESVQQIINTYRPSVRSIKPSLKNFTMLATRFAGAGMADVLVSAYQLNNTEGLEAAYNYLEDQARLRNIR